MYEEGIEPLRGSWLSGREPRWGDRWIARHPILGFLAGCGIVYVVPTALAMLWAGRWVNPFSSQAPPVSLPVFILGLFFSAWVVFSTRRRVRLRA